MAVNLSPVGGVAAQFFDNSGNVLTGGKIYTYTAGTTTPQVTYTSATGVTAHSNPIILDASGRVPSGEIWLTDGLSYKFLVKTSTDVLIGTYDNVIGINSNFINFLTETEIQTATAGQTVFTLTTMQYQPATNSLSVFVDGVNQYDGVSYSYVETSSTVVTFTAGLHVGALVKFTTAQTLSSGVTDASLVTFTGFKGQVGNVQNLADNDGSDWIGFEPSGTGAVARSAQDKMLDTVSVKDFGAAGDGVTDDTVAIQAAIDSLAGTIYFPDGTYITSATIVMDNNNQTLQGSGRNKASIDADFRGGAVIQIQKARCAVCDIAVSTKFGSSRRNASPLGKTAPDNSVDGNSTDHGIVLLETTSFTTYTHIARVDIVYQPAYGLAQFGAGGGTIIEQVGVTYCGGHGMYFDNGGKLGTTLTRNGIVDIESCIIQECWGDGVAIGIYGPNTSFRFRLINLDIFENCKGDGGTFQPAFLVTNGGQIEAACEQLLIDSCAVGDSINGINMSNSNSVIISNSRIVDISTRGVVFNPDCYNIQVVNPYCIGTKPSIGFRVQTGCENVEMRGFISSQWSSVVVDAESEVRLLIDNRDALTVPGSNSFFYNTGIVTSTVSTGNLNVQGKTVSVIGEGGVADSVSVFRFVSAVEVPDGYMFTVSNFQAYNITLQDRTVLGSGNLELQGVNAVLGPNESLSFISNGGVYYAINRGIP